ncbi:hypothetical protein [Streptomyces violaceusniger]|uniref:Uncharacterized protein n=1 Tax=Streptomyces violaceusniger (strain Tu 4113) TaxID=653045 RepID=G2PHW0_STRV4|nr:hypothetical protein [Streptomyces violaceusniger]AEM88911.1 hypothetical protein Strvi_0136 [Streptomyces violaceusniger Tu 4113]
MAHGITLERRLKLLTRAAADMRPVLIGYNAENPCPRSTGGDQIIEIHNVQSSKAGDIVLDAWCRMCGHVERFRLDRITRHRTLRVKLQGPVPPCTPYFTARGPVGVAQLTRPISAKPTSGGLLSRARSRMDDAARFQELFGPTETYPRRKIALTTGELLADVRGLIRHAGQNTPEADDSRFRAVFGSPLAYPERHPSATTADDHIREMHQNMKRWKALHASVAWVERFRSLSDELDKNGGIDSPAYQTRYRARITALLAESPKNRGLLV